MKKRVLCVRFIRCFHYCITYSVILKKRLGPSYLLMIRSFVRRINFFCTSNEAGISSFEVAFLSLEQLA